MIACGMDKNSSIISPVRHFLNKTNIGPYYIYNMFDLYYSLRSYEQPRLHNNSACFFNTAPDDYTPLSQTVVFTNSVPAVECVTILLVDDLTSSNEGLEEFTVMMTSQNSFVLIDPGSATIFITDNNDGKN